MPGLFDSWIRETKETVTKQQQKPKTKENRQNQDEFSDCGIYNGFARDVVILDRTLKSEVIAQVARFIIVTTRHMHTLESSDALHLSKLSISVCVALE